MPGLLELQRAFLASVAGPGADLPAAWFAGDPARAALGLSAHATTVRHARADALGQSFPLTLEHLGRDFPNRAEAYLERLGPTRQMMQEIGGGFADHLLEGGEPEAAGIARIEWSALRAHHAADAPALGWGDIAPAGNPLTLRAAMHPAASVLRAHAATMRRFGLDPGEAEYLLIARPGLEVRLRPVAEAVAILADAFGAGRQVALAVRKTGLTEEAAFTAFAILLDAGALVAVVRR